MGGPRVSVILTTYNWPQALALVLTGLEQQTVAGFQVLVADDGSGPDTAAAVAAAQRRGRLDLTHVWQEDQGFRAAAIRNRAVAAAGGDYLLFLDGDCLVRADFIARHLALARPGWLVAGNRVLLSRALSQAVLADSAGLRIADWDPGRWLRVRVRGGVNRVLPLARLPGRAWRRLAPRRWQGARTCNLGLWREDFVAVNGFDEAYQGWGYEDSDLTIRLLRTGVRRLDGRFATAVLHLWHPEQPRSAGAANWERFQHSARDGPLRAPLGLDRYLP